MKRSRVLFLCIHNSARSQMAEGFLQQIAGDRFDAVSAGFSPGTLNPLVVQAMAEIGIDIADKTTKSVFDLYKSGALFSYVISVCDKANESNCPVFPGVSHRINWNFDDPSQFTGTDEEKLSRIRLVRDSIREHVEKFVSEHS